MWVLGLNAPPLGWHDPAACLVDGDGNVHIMIEEERVSRRKHGLHTYPCKAAAACLEAVGITPADIDLVAIGWDMPRHSARSDLDQLDPPILGRPWEFGDSREFLTTALGWKLDPMRHPELVFVPHHQAHACASFYASGYREAAVLVVDAVGDEESVSIYDARHGRPLVRRDRWPIPNSLGYMYNIVSEMIGLSFLEAGKTMGLAAYGKARDVVPWPIFEVDGDSFAPPFDLAPNAAHGEIASSWLQHFLRLGITRTHSSAETLDKDDDAVRLAWSAQASLQEVFAMLAQRARRVTGHDNLCMSGGVALNCSSNGLLEPPIYVPPVPHDAGVSLGAAWSVVPPGYSGQPLSPYLGRTVPTVEIDSAISRHGVTAKPLSTEEVAERLLAGDMGAIVSGKAEVGPRALCHRSILATPATADMRDRLNRLKGREPWRPLGPVGLPECEGKYWTGHPTLHQYMVGASRTSDVACEELPAIVHIDGTARPQVVTSRDEPIRAVLEQLKKLGAPPVAINTSFNRRGEPIVDDADGAVRSARDIGLDFLILGDRLIDV